MSGLLPSVSAFRPLFFFGIGEGLPLTFPETREPERPEIASAFFCSVRFFSFFSFPCIRIRCNGFFYLPEDREPSQSETEPGDFQQQKQRRQKRRKMMKWKASLLRADIPEDSLHVQTFLPAGGFRDAFERFPAACGIGFRAELLRINPGEHARRNGMGTGKWRREGRGE